MVSRRVFSAKKPEEAAGSRSFPNQSGAILAKLGRQHFCCPKPAKMRPLFVELPWRVTWTISNNASRKSWQNSLAWPRQTSRTNPRS
ncbi:hypothetical protein CBM2606_A130040 [Cupriavidus taiwanensis]|nr:hypothetical protein CBM2606_A130040 [Cupriavidus taiwanensis]